MREKKKSKKESVRDFYVRIAAEVFSKFGFRKTTLDDISQAAGKTKTGIYYYFDNKESIFKAVVSREIELIKEETINVLATLKDPQEKLKAYLHIRLKRLRELSNVYEALKSDLLESLEFINEIRSTYDALEFSIIRNILDEGCTIGTFAPIDTEKTTEAMAGIIKGLELPFFIKSYNFDLESRIEDLLHILFYGLAKK